MSPTPHASRLAPERPFPPYSYVPGRFPHPTSDPKGHSFGIDEESPAPPDLDDWRGSRAYLYGIDLFNHGYYWEAHEVWEGRWKACGRTGTAATLLKALIKLAAAGVKARERNAAGVRRHARRAAELFGLARSEGATEKPLQMGLSLAELAATARGVAESPALEVDDSREADVQVVFHFKLTPR